jgi:hypothetical protein
MRLKIKGQKLKYRLEYFRREDDFKVNFPKYDVHSKGAIKKDGKWVECLFYVNDFRGKTSIEISSKSIVKDGISDLGKVDEHFIYKKLEVNRFNRFLILLYERIFYLKLRLKGYIDRLIPIKTNLIYVFIAVFGAILYFFINHLFDNFLQDLINQSNLVQSIIVFLSLSSIINIFHPFTFRKELNIKEVNELVEKKSEKAIQDLIKNTRSKERRDQY